MKLSTREIEFTGRPENDRTVFKDWEQGFLDPYISALKISQNNRLSQFLNAEEFIELAHSLGYWRGLLPDEIVQAICEYERTHK